MDIKSISEDGSPVGVVGMELVHPTLQTTKLKPVRTNLHQARLA